jgi:hypothetical protein
MLIIETPGKSDFAARLSGLIIFGESFSYNDPEHFYSDIKRHLVDRKSPWAWKDKVKWGWTVKHVQKFAHPVTLSGPKGIRFSTSIRIPKALCRELDCFLETKG